MQTPQLTLFVDGYFTSVWDASVIVALSEKQIEFTVARAMLNDNHLPPALSQHTSIPRIPALLHGDFWVTESLAIIEYLEELFPAPGYTAVLPPTLRARARARQIMAWIRFDLRALRSERPFQLAIYPPRATPPVTDHPPLTEAGARDASQLIELVLRLSASGELAEWNIAHADLAFALLRLARSDHPLPAAAQDLLDHNLARPSVRAYLEHPRPPNPPPYARS